MNVDYKLEHHFRPHKGWMNDPNGLVSFKGKYHAFYQYVKEFEQPWHAPMTWGHAVTEDFLEWEELPVALFADGEYDADGCWSGTAAVENDTLYLFYASVVGDGDGFKQTISVAYSEDGINFKKYKNNPVIKSFPPDGSKDFRDPAVIKLAEGDYRMVIASGNPKKETGCLLIYESRNLLDWKYIGVMCEWKNSKYCECPSFVKSGDKFILTTSVVRTDDSNFFTALYGEFDGRQFKAEIESRFQKGPDQYAGQVFHDCNGRNILISWLPGWKYQNFAEKSIGCLSLPVELNVIDGKIKAYPISEVRHLLKSDDDAVEIYNDGFILKRTLEDDVIYKGEINDIKILRDKYITEIFINEGEAIYSAVC